MVKFELMSNDEIIDNYKRLKLLQRTKNSEYYKRLKQNPEMYEQRLKSAKEQQEKRVELIKNDEELLEDFKNRRSYTNSLYYYSHN